MRLICGAFNAQALPKSLLDRTKEVSCGVEACERIMRTKQGSERGQEQTKQGAWKAPHVRSSEKPIFRPGEGWLASFLCHLFSVYCVSSALAGPDWLVDWPVHWSAWTGDQVCGDFFWSLYPVSVTVSEKMLMLFYKCQTWFIKCRSFEGLCVKVWCSVSVCETCKSEQEEMNSCCKLLQIWWNGPYMTKEKQHKQLAFKVGGGTWSGDSGKNRKKLIFLK